MRERERDKHSAHLFLVGHGSHIFCEDLAHKVPGFCHYGTHQLVDKCLVWLQVVKILEKHDPLKNTQAKYGSIPPDEASAVQNYVEHMLFLLIEEQAKDAAMGPILEFVVSENIMEKLFLWSLRREFTDDTKVEQLKMYEMLVTQSHQPLLHHKPILKPLMMLLSSCSGTATPAVEGKLVVLLNQLCSILAKDPSILELFFHTSEDQGAANFLIFSLLIPFIHREGTVGQQARDALLFIMSLSAENSMVAHHIVENTYFCPVSPTPLIAMLSPSPLSFLVLVINTLLVLFSQLYLAPSLERYLQDIFGRGQGNLKLRCYLVEQCQLKIWNLHV